MLLQSTYGPCLCYSTLYGSLQCAALVMTVYQNHYLTGIHYSAHTNRKCVLGHFIDIVNKETTVGNNGVSSQRFNACATYQT